MIGSGPGDCPEVEARMLPLGALRLPASLQGGGIFGKPGEQPEGIADGPHRVGPDEPAVVE